MKPEKFIFITLLTILYFFVGRFIGWTFLSNTEFWNRIINDNLHHYQLGIIFLLISSILLKKQIKLGLYLLAIGSGMIIDESMYVFEFINPTIFTHYHPVGITIELIVFLIFSAFILKNKKRLTNLSNSKI